MKSAMRFLYGLILSGFLAAVATSPAPADMLLTGAGKPPSGITYVGPGDVSVNGSTNNWYAWGSCARVYKTSLASTSTSLCDLVAITGGAAVCTLRGTATGFVDLSAYCPGSVTPAAACAAASGGSCKVSQVYDQTGNGRPWNTSTSTATSPDLVFASLDSLPVMQCTAATCFIDPTAVTIALPITLSAVFIRTSGVTRAGIIAAGSASVGMLTTIANTVNADANSGTGAANTATDGTWHALNGVINSGTTCAINVDGSEPALATCGSTGFNTQNVRLFRSGAVQLAGRIAEAGLLAVTSSPTDRNNIRSNSKIAYPSLP